MLLFNLATPTSRIDKKTLTCWKSSPKLAGVLCRNFPTAAVQDLDLAYSKALKQGGFKELDFIREEGVSFNPRAARLALIQIEEADLKDFRLLLANFALIYQPGPIDDLTEVDESLIRLFHWLDRARHVHLSSKENIPALTTQMLKESCVAVKTASELAPLLSQKVSMWCQRAKLLKAQ